MRNEQTLSKLKEMRLTGMAELYEEQTNDLSYETLTFEERFNLLVDSEYARRRAAQVARFMAVATLSDTTASVESIEYHPDRRLDKDLIVKLSSGVYIEQHHNVIFMGASGNGKTFLANALGVQACRQRFKVKYIRLPELIDELALAKHAADGSYRKLIKKYTKIDLLILDEWLILPLPVEESLHVLEIIEARLKKASTIFCSQFSPEGWYEKFENPQLADSILDRIIHDSFTVLVDGEISMRERHGLKRRELS